VAQTGHYAEHVAQMIQIYAQHIAPANAHGLLGAVFDFEWVHFTYNVGLELLLIGLWLAYRTAAKAGTATVEPVGLSLLTGLVLFQGYHSIEHFAKLYQYLFMPLYQSGMPPTPGIVPLVTGWRIFLVHFWLNTVVWVVMVIALWYLRPKFAAPTSTLARA
jgi:hypothetical protein